MCWCNRDIAVPCCGGIGCTPPSTADVMRATGEKNAELFKRLSARRPPPNLYDVDAHLELVLRCLANNEAGEAMRYLVGLRTWIAKARP